MADACININNVARHFGIHKTTANRTINRFWQTGFAGDCRKSNSPKKKKQKPKGALIAHLSTMNTRNCIEIHQNN